MLCFLYTGEIKFAPFSSDPRRGLPAQARTGDWNAGSLSSPSAKSIYRLADMVTTSPCLTSPRLISFSMIYQLSNSALRCTSTITWHTATSWMKYFPVSPSCESPAHLSSPQILIPRCSFPEILSVQVSRLVCMMKEEYVGDTEGIIQKQLQDKLATLSQSQLMRATDALAMIWSGVTGQLDQLAPEPKPAFPVAPILLPNWHRVRLALLRSISTGAFIDVQFYAYNAIGNDVPLDPRPLFTSSIVIEEWAPAITTRKWHGSSRFTRC